MAPPEPSTAPKPAELTNGAPASQDKADAVHRLQRLVKVQAAQIAELRKRLSSQTPAHELPRAGVNASRQSANLNIRRAPLVAGRDDRIMQLMKRRSVFQLHNPAKRRRENDAQSSAGDASTAPPASDVENKDVNGEGEDENKHIEQSIDPIVQPPREPAPSQTGQQPRPISVVKFNQMMKSLAENYSSYEEAYQAVMKARDEFENVTQTAQKYYLDSMKAELRLELAIAKGFLTEKALEDGLRELLEVDVRVSALQEHKDGVPIVPLRGRCVDTPVNHNLVEVVCEIWKYRIREYFERTSKK